MKVLIIERDSILAKKYLNTLSMFKSENLEFEWLPGKVKNQDNKNILSYDNSIIEEIKTRYEENPDIGILLNPIISEEAFKTPLRGIYPHDTLSLKIDMTFEKILPIYYVSEVFNFNAHICEIMGLYSSRPYILSQWLSGEDNFNFQIEIPKMFEFYLNNRLRTKKEDNNDKNSILIKKLLNVINKK